MVYGNLNLTLSNLFWKITLIPSLTIPNFQKFSSRRLLSSIKNINRFLITLWKNISKSTTSFQYITLWKIQTSPSSKQSKTVTYYKVNITEKIKGTGNCKEKEVIYAEQCSKQSFVYWTNRRTTVRALSKHRYNIKNKLENSELAKYFHQSHNTNGKLEVTILQNNIKTAAAQR